MIVAGFERLRTGRPGRATDATLGFAANFLYMPHRQKAGCGDDPRFRRRSYPSCRPRAECFDFAARVTAATLSDIYSCVVSGIGALKGPLHGGANEEVIKMLLEVGTADKAVERVHEMFAKKIKIPASAIACTAPKIRAPRTFAECPRNSVRARGTRNCISCRNGSKRRCRAEKKLNPNVDFYSASTYYSLGIPVDLFTPIFAVSRMAGWTAHVLEQYHNNRLIRPRAEYKGNPDGMPWIPMGPS